MLETKKSLEQQLENVQKNISDTLGLVQGLIEQSNSLTEFINKLEEKKKADEKEIKQLKEINDGITEKINGLMDSLSVLFEEYDKFMRESLN